MGVLKVLKGTLSTLGKKNRNGRIYSKELWENVLNSEYWNDMMSNNSLFGECVHPADNRSTSDSFEIDANNVSHRIKEAHIEGDKLIGTVEILDTQAGKNIAALIDSGCNIGISARGAGDLNGDIVDADTYQFKTFDLTFRPSDYNARLVPLTESEKKNFKPIKESEESDTLIKGSEEIGTTEIDNKSLKDKVVRRYIDGYSDKPIQFSNFKIEIFPTTSDTEKIRVSVYDKKHDAREIIGYVDKDSLYTDDSLVDKILDAMSSSYEYDL